jgi:CRISPR-associated protein Cmr4
MKNCVIGMVAETAIHFGVGRSEGVVDLPIAREAATDYPVIYGSGLKGAFRQYVLGNDSGYQEWISAFYTAEERKEFETPDYINRWFGKVDGAGCLCFSDARILLYPVRCMTGSFVWITCPTVLKRFKRDMERFGVSLSFEVPELGEEKNASGSDKEMAVEAVAACNVLDDAILLEDQVFRAREEKSVIESIASAVEPFIAVDALCSELAKRIVVLGDADFTHFVRFGVPIVARNVLEETTKKSENLWYEEHLPGDTIMYCGVAARHVDVESFMEQIMKHHYVQVGGNATVGQGWFKMQCVGGK